MNLHSFRCLEYTTILELVAELASSPLGREECLKTVPAGEEELVKLHQMQVKEVRDLEKTEGSLPIFDIFDLRPYLEMLKARGAVLGVSELLEIKKTLSSVQRLRSWESKCVRFYPNIKALLSELVSLDELHELLKNSISDWGTIKDSASPKLRNIRKKLNALRDEISAHFASLFSRKGMDRVFHDRVISVRNNRFVVAVRSESKGLVKGIIHDVSQSGATVYLEPLELVSLNNTWNELHQAQKNEERKVLARLSDRVREHSWEISRNLEMLGVLDAVRAKARFGEIIGGRTAEISEKELKLKNAYHPLLLLQHLSAKTPHILPESLKEKLVSPRSSPVPYTDPVPISLALTPECRTLIISGPNAGGKTVTLKTTGLLSLMNQSGIPVPVDEGSKFKIFQGIYVDIGDEQDIKTNLSTFSARVENLKVILQSISDESLVLLDELGTGTDPAEGASLALATIEYLKDKGAWTLVTTHFHVLKAYGSISEGVENVSVSFDELSGKPTYKLHFGLSGTSNAFDIARRHGFPGAVLERAKILLEKSEGGNNRLLSELERVQRETEALRNELEEERNRVRELREKLEEEREKLESDRHEILREAFNDARKVIENTESEFRKLLRRFRKEGLREAPRIKHEIAVIKKLATEKLKPRKPVSAEETRLRGKVKVGRPVKILSFNKVGKLLRLSPERNFAEVQIGNLQVRVSPDDLIPCLGGKSPGKMQDDKKQAFRFPLPSRVSKELNLVGKTVEEAIEELDKAIDAAILAGIEEISIIHGHGTGRLRAGIHSYLDTNPQVSNYYFPELRMGGRGVTIVELKG